jgi:oligoribonuclease NrnB/cAMP/cGMP phosphodiesterase (DHH superfamily)
MKTPSQKIVVIYHGDCPDGFGGAYAAWKKFGAKAAYIPASGWSALPCPLKRKEVYLIDYTYNDEALIKKLIRDNVRVTAIDHHITAERAVKLTQDYSFALDHSGAVLAWQYFHPGKKMPMILRYIEDRDIWRWKVPSSEAVLAYFDLSERSFAAWDKAAKELEQARQRKLYKEKGELVLRYRKTVFDSMLPGVEKVRFAGRTVLAINAPQYFASELGNALARKTRSFAIVWRESAGTIKVSLRSVGAVDVAKIAKKFGGGGHKNASAFSFIVAASGITFPWKVVKGASPKSK